MLKTTMQNENFTPKYENIKVDLNKQKEGHTMFLDRKT